MRRTQRPSANHAADRRAALLALALLCQACGIDPERSPGLQTEREVTGLRLRNVKDGTNSEMPCAGVFPFIGVDPNSAFMPASLVTPAGHVETGPDLSTPDPRIFAVGAVRAGYGGNIAQAMAEGMSAAQAAARLLAD